MDLLLTTSRDFKYSTNPARVDYACPAYVNQAPAWQVVDDVRNNWRVMRKQKETYLPRFESESQKDWEARVALTFPKDHYASTLEEHVGLVFGTAPQLDKDVPAKLRELCEDIDGEGNHIEVFLETAFDSALHFGHSVLYTDYPPAAEFKNKQDERRAKARPYAQLYRAPDVLSWEEVAIGGVKVIVKIKFRETTTKSFGEFGVTEVSRFREVKQDVEYDLVTGTALALGAITWRTWEEETQSGTTGEAPSELGAKPLDNGTIIGPAQIPIRVIYGGRKLGTLNTIPHLLGVALTNVEETQVESDYAHVMHKCNVPTPVFVNRDIPEGGNNTVKMGEGIDIRGQGANAFFLEPAGVAIGATRTRIEDIRAHMRRMGATSADLGDKTMTAREAGIYAKQRDAKLKRGSRSLKDAGEGMLADMASFLNLDTGNSVKSGGSLIISQDFAGQTIDPAYLSVLVQAYVANAFPLEALLYAMKNGRLPDEFSAQDEALKLLAGEIARQEEVEAEAKRQVELAKQNPKENPPADKPADTPAEKPPAPEAEP